MYWKYFWAVIRHKFFVLVECVKDGRQSSDPIWFFTMLWRGLVHDMSKFLPGEFIPYARFFNGPRDASGHVPRDVMKAFDVAWLKHLHRNKHHHQYWVLKMDEGGAKCLTMPLHYVKEMVCDWRGAGRAYGKNNVNEWYKENKDDMSLSKRTRCKVEEFIGHKE